MVYLYANLPRDTAPQKTEKERAAGGGACVTGHTPYCYYHHHYYYVVIVIVLHAVIADGAQWGENDRRPPGLSAIGRLVNVRGRVTMTEKQAVADVYALRLCTIIIIIVVISMTFHPRCVRACVRRPWPVLRRHPRVRVVCFRTGLCMCACCLRRAHQKRIHIFRTRRHGVFCNTHLFEQQYILGIPPKGDKLCIFFF